MSVIWKWPLSVRYATVYDGQPRQRSVGNIEWEKGPRPYYCTCSRVAWLRHKFTGGIQQMHAALGGKVEERVLHLSNCWNWGALTPLRLPYLTPPLSLSLSPTSSFPHPIPISRSSPPSLPRSIPPTSSVPLSCRVERCFPDISRKKPPRTLMVLKGVLRDVHVFAFIYHKCSPALSLRLNGTSWREGGEKKRGERSHK